MNEFYEAETPKFTGPELKAKFGQTPLERPMTDAEWAKQADTLNAAKYFRNDTYQVAINQNGAFLHLSIKRIDRMPIKEWRDLQTIKNELVGPEWEAVELYPAESRLVDSANQYHLWIFTGEGESFRWPFGYNERLVVDGTGEIAPDGTRQAPFAKSGA